MDKKLITLASVNGAVAVAIGAFGAHALKAKLAIYGQSAFETGSKYHFYFSIILLTLALIITTVPSFKNITLKRSFYLFFIGTFLFSGSLYALSMLGTEPNTIKSLLGPTTPIGGILLILGWFNLLFLVKKYNP
jgi:uncharacterized membrane protein YgdD (TMEM256/DUF423 family)